MTFWAHDLALLSLACYFVASPVFTALHVLFFFSGALYHLVPTECRDLIRKILAVNMADRIHLAQARRHPWMVADTKSVNSVPWPPIPRVQSAAKPAPTVKYELGLDTTNVEKKKSKLSKTDQSEPKSRRATIDPSELVKFKASSARERAREKAVEREKAIKESEKERENDKDTVPELPREAAAAKPDNDSAAADARSVCTKYTHLTFCPVCLSVLSMLLFLHMLKSCNQRADLSQPLNIQAGCPMFADHIHVKLLAGVLALAVLCRLIHNFCFE